jgi:UDP-N-acetylmuramate dehydrogenase
MLSLASLELSGEVTYDVSLKSKTWLGVGGKADIFFQPQSHEALHAGLHLFQAYPWWVLGRGSNVLIRDGGIRGVVLFLGHQAFQTCVVDHTKVTIGAGCYNRLFCQKMMQEGIDSFVFLSGIPGNIGGALWMNAGCYGQTTGDLLESAKWIDHQGVLHETMGCTLPKQYRHMGFPKGAILLSGTFRLNETRVLPEDVKKAMLELQQKRYLSQPVQAKTAGSLFKNPPGDSAWRLIDAVGGRGLSIGDAMLSHQHCNFLINRGHATAHDLETLILEVHHRVFKAFNIDLAWEVERVGEP